MSRMSYPLYFFLKGKITYLAYEQCFQRGIRECDSELLILPIDPSSSQNYIRSWKITSGLQSKGQKKIYTQQSVDALKEIKQQLYYSVILAASSKLARFIAYLSQFLSINPSGQLQYFAPDSLVLHIPSFRQGHMEMQLAPSERDNSNNTQMNRICYRSLYQVRIIFQRQQRRIMFINTKCYLFQRIYYDDLSRIKFFLVDYFKLQMDAESVIFVVLVSLIILSISSAYINIYLASLYHQNITYFWIYFPIYGFILLMLLISYYRAVFTPPGYTDPLDNSKYSHEQFLVFRQNAEKQKQRRQQRKKARYGSDPSQITQLKETGYCERCEAVKPPRAHHCKICEKCIVRMDHHCPWVGNCIGIRNHKFFILFLLYATVGLSMTWVTLCIDAFRDWKYVSSFYDQDTAIFMMVATTIASILLSLSIGALFVGQTLGLIKNLTTLESFIPHIQENSPFDTRDWEENFNEIFGEKYWLLPISPQLKQNVF